MKWSFVLYLWNEILRNMIAIFTRSRSHSPRFLSFYLRKRKHGTVSTVMWLRSNLKKWRSSGKAKPWQENVDFILDLLYFSGVRKLRLGKR
jgi:hypothetical protein